MATFQFAHAEGHEGHGSSDLRDKVGRNPTGASVNNVTRSRGSDGSVNWLTTGSLYSDQPPSDSDPRLRFGAHRSRPLGIEPCTLQETTEGL